MRLRSLNVLSLLVMLVVWEVASWVAPLEILPGPGATFRAFWSNLIQGQLLPNLAQTLKRVGIGFGLALVLGVFAGVAMGLRRVFEALLSYPVLILLSIPSLGYVILGVMWFGLTEFAGFFVIAAIGFPMVVINVNEGVKNVDKALIEMARAYGAPNGKVIRDLVLPSIFPYVLAGCRYGIGVAWKIAIIAEMVGMSSGVGYMLQYNYALFRMDQVLAWILVFTLVIILVDRGLWSQLEHRLMSWRPTIVE
ncbi:MAG: ABC transporter permease [Deltaproteobacteria bacterium]|nr:ABC transporter permease [Deltaproteobacteria bacterium]